MFANITNNQIANNIQSQFTQFVFFTISLTAQQSDQSLRTPI